MAYTTVSELLARQAERSSVRTFLRWTDRQRSLTFAEVETASAKAAALFASLGVGSGDRVGLLAHNGLDYVIAMFGAWRIGAISAHISVLTVDDLASFANACSPKVLVYTHDVFEAIDRDRPSMPSIEHYFCMDGAQPGAQSWGEALSSADPLASLNRDSSLPFHLSFTSGSTGRPKAAVLAVESTMRATACIAERLQLSSSDVSLGATSPASSYGLVAHWLPGLHKGMSVGIRKAWEVGGIVDDIERDGVTLLASNPPQLNELLMRVRERGSAPASLQLVVSGGEAVPQELKRAYFDELGVSFCESYGQSELGGFVALGRRARPTDELLRAVGEPLPDKDVRVLDDAGNEVPTGAPGELCIRGGFMWGYWGEDEKTAHTLRDGWLHTGDLGKAVATGEVMTLGRYSERIETASGLVLPRPIEEAIMAVHPSVRHVAVVSAPDGPRAVVALWAGADAVSAADLLRAYRTNDHADQRLNDVVVIESMPMTSTGKLDRVALTTLYG